MDAIKDRRLKTVQYSGGLLKCFNLLKDETITRSNHSREVNNFIFSSMLSVVGAKLLNRVKPKVTLPYTRELVVRYYDLDTTQEYLNLPGVQDIRIAKSNDPTGRGYTYLLISKSKLLSLKNTIEQYLYMLDCQYECMKVFFEKFKIPLEGLETAYNELKTDDFFFRACTPGIHKKTRIMAGVSKRFELEHDVYLFKVLDENYNVIFLHDLPPAPHEHIILEEMSEKKLDPVELMDKKEYPITGYLGNGWKKDVFYFTWGNPAISKDAIFYEFHLSTMELKRMN